MFPSGDGPILYSSIFYVFQDGCNYGNLGKFNSRHVGFLHTMLRCDAARVDSVETHIMDALKGIRPSK